MSTHPENINGGVSIIWKLENYHSIKTFRLTYVVLEWPDMKSQWLLMIPIFLKQANGKSIEIWIKKLDKIAPITLSGIISGVSGKFCFKLNQFDRLNFEENEDKRCVIKIDLELFKYTDSEKQDFINDSLTFHLNLWDPIINDTIGAEYFIRSTYCQQTCIFQWMLDGNQDWKKNGDYTESTIEIPTVFKYFANIDKKLKINFNLHVKDHETFASVFVEDYDPSESNLCYFCKLIVQRKKETNPPLLETGWSEVYHYEGKDLQKIIEEEWDYLSTKWIVTVEFIVSTPYNGVIEEVSYKPSFQNLKRKLTMSKQNRFFKNTLQQCLYNFYKEGEHCDVVLHANNETFPCHKVVLCSRSPIFKTMFENNMIEKETNVVNIADVESPILEKFLNYLYLDNLACENFDLAAKLYEVADKYSVINLQEECANIIVSSLSTSNVCQALDLAESHQDKDLKEDIISYISEHIKEIVKSSSWEQFLLTKPVLAAKTLQAAITYKL